MNLLYYIVVSTSWLMVVAVLLPFVRNDYWIFRAFEYPRFQKLVVCIVVLALLVVLGRTTTLSTITMTALAFCILFLLYHVSPYTSIAKKEMLTVSSTEHSNQLKIFTANIYQDNDQFDKLLGLVHEKDPDLIFLLETDQKWHKAMEVLQNDYPYNVCEPKDNTYGMLFYSRLPITSGGIAYLVDDEVPSMEVIIHLPSGQPVKIWGLHPKPPVPTEDTHSTAKDKELLKIAFKAKEEKLPAIVLGDLNDVAWSHITRLFRKTSGLLDPRRGRGFYSTFSANSRWMRFPLDYIFCSSYFGLIHMERLRYFGSDHFPMFIHLEYQPQLAAEQKAPQAAKDELEEAGAKATEVV